MKKIAKIFLVDQIPLDEIKGKVIAVDAMNHIARINISSQKLNLHFEKRWGWFAIAIREWFRPIFVFEGAQDPRKGYARPSRDLMPICKRILTVLRIPWIDAPADAEAQAAHLAKNGYAWGVMSTDYDAILYGTPRLLKKVNFSTKSAEVIFVEKTLEHYRISLDDLIKIAIISGTSIFPPKMGIKTALEKYKVENIPLEQIREYKEPLIVDYKHEFFWGFPDITDLQRLRDFGFSRMEISRIYKRLKKSEILNRAKLDEYLI